MQISKKHKLTTLFTAGVMGLATAGINYIRSAYQNYAHQVRLADSDFKPDAFVVLTGGSGRIKTAFQICGADQKIFISGCNKGTTYTGLLKATKLNPGELKLRKDNVIIGSEALDTVGNILEILEFLEQNPAIRNITI